ncbi:MAG: ATP-binding protein, partial [Planctomycetota bacterium]
LADICAEVADALDATCKENDVELSFELSPALAGLQTDARLLQLILRNLAENAVKYTHPGTGVRVVAERLPTLEAPLDGMVLRIIDEGPGIPIAKQARVFERFFQVDPARTGSASRGTGLGLAIVKHAAKLLDGTVDVESVWGEGTTMVVSLPTSVRRTESKPANASDQGA